TATTTASSSCSTPSTGRADINKSSCSPAGSALSRHSAAIPCACRRANENPLFGGQMDTIDRQRVDQWHVFRNGKRYGPYPFSTLVEAVKRGALSKDDQVWCPGWAAWRRAHSVPELFVPPDGNRGLHTPRVDTHAVHAPANTAAQDTAAK